MPEIKRALLKHGIEVKDKDVPYLSELVSIIDSAQAPLAYFPNINEEVPIVIVDPEVIKFG